MSDEPIRLVTTGYIPVPEETIREVEEAIADLRSGVLTGFALIVVGPESAGHRFGFSGSRMDRMQLLGNLAMMQRKLEDVELELTL